jgi:hypothetical protein
MYGIYLLQTYCTFVCYIHTYTGQDEVVYIQAKMRSILSRSNAYVFVYVSKRMMMI